MAKSSQSGEYKKEAPVLRGLLMLALEIFLFASVNSPVAQFFLDA
jgi:hypothetical protein